GRARKEDTVQAAAGVRLLVEPGDPVKPGTPLAELHTDTPDRIPSARAALKGAALLITNDPGARVARTLVLDTLRPRS
ncbi:MAG: thymidine phosphorylase, partial [Pseudonocardia sediminis]